MAAVDVLVRNYSQEGITYVIKSKSLNCVSLKILGLGIGKKKIKFDAEQLNIQEFREKMSFKKVNSAYLLQILTEHSLEKFFQKSTKKIDYNSDDDLGIVGPLSKMHMTDRQTTIPVIAMTINCLDQNIKGSELIEIAHEIVQTFYRKTIDLASEYEKDNDGPLIQPPNVKNGILNIKAKKDWIMSLGGWKGMMPSEEVSHFFFYDFDSTKNPKERFRGVKIGDNNPVFTITDGRICIPNGFCINGFNVTAYIKKVDERWITGTGKTDLSYSQIVEAITKIKKMFGLIDGLIAFSQLCLLDDGTLPKVMTEQIPNEHCDKVRQFLEYLNALMFGIEASGLNAAIVTSLLTLDLIADEKMTYSEAFKGNNDGGYYPYACFGNNKGTYSEREKVLIHKKTSHDAMSMQNLRENPALSPVGNKEAILIKFWLESNNVIKEHITYSKQKLAIESAMTDIFHYFFSDCRNHDRKHQVLLEKFKS